MDYQKLQLATYLRDQATLRIQHEVRHMLRDNAEAYRKEHLVRIAAEIADELTDIVNAVDANAAARDDRDLPPRWD